jgi:hypothetical protein
MKRITTDELKHMTDKEGLILQGCGGDPDEWLKGINEGGPEENVPQTSVYIENAHAGDIGGVTVPLPTTAETLQSRFAAIKTDKNGRAGAFRDVNSPLPELEDALADIVPPGSRGDVIEELNYLAVKINGLDEESRKTFCGALAAGRHCRSLAEMINLTENLDRFDLRPEYSAETYGGFLLDADWDSHRETFNRILGSGNPKNRAFAEYIIKLEEYIDKAAYGRAAAKEENGVFTKYGYLTESGAGFREVYRGPRDIPAEFRLFAPESFAVVKDVDLAPFLVKFCAVTGCPRREAERALDTLTGLRGGEYLLLLDGQRSFLAEADHVYRNGSDAFEAWMVGSDKAQAFAIHATEIRGRIAGDVVPLDCTEYRYGVLNASIRPDRIDAVFKDGSEKSFAPKEWTDLPSGERDGAESRTMHFTHEDLRSVVRALNNIRAEHEEHGKPVSEGDFLTNVNKAYMERAECPQPGMLRIMPDAAREMLARGDAAVYRLLPSCAKKLPPMDAVKSGGLQYMNNCEFAVRCGDLSGLDKWAERAAGNILRRVEREEHKKSHDPVI